MSEQQLQEQKDRLFAAIAEDDLLAVSALLTAPGVSSEIRGKLDRTPLIEAVCRGSMSVISYLLEHGADVNAIDGQACSALRRAVQYGRVEVMRRLLANGAHTNGFDRSGFTVLTFGAVFLRGAARKQVLSLLTEVGVSIDQRTRFGFTTLLIGCHYGESDLVRLVLEMGADPGLRTPAGSDASQTAAAAGHADVAEFVRTWKANHQ